MLGPMFCYSHPRKQKHRAGGFIWRRYSGFSFWYFHSRCFKEVHCVACGNLFYFLYCAVAVDVGNGAFYCDGIDDAIVGKTSGIKYWDHPFWHARAKLLPKPQSMGSVDPRLKTPIKTEL